MLRLAARRALSSRRASPPPPPLAPPLRALSTPHALPDDASPPPKPPSRWTLLRAARKAAPPPRNRAAPTHDRRAEYELGAAVGHMRSAAWASFDESVELIFRLNVDPRHAEQNIRGAAALPHGAGAAARVAVFAHEGAAADAARAAGADVVGGAELVGRVVETKGRVLGEVAACVATPELLPLLAKGAGRVLGPRGIMPNVKTGTVTGDVGEAVARLKRGQCKFRTDRYGTVQTKVGKLSMDDGRLVENCVAVVRAVIAARPESVRKKYMKGAFLGSAMGPSIRLDTKALTRDALAVPPEVAAGAAVAG